MRSALFAFHSTDEELSAGTHELHPTDENLFAGTQQLEVSQDRCFLFADL